MKIAIMQPYFFPYVGYFQLIRAVDKFVLYDDVQWIKGGWINRNRIQIGGRPHYITIPVSTEGTLKSICDRQLAADRPAAVQKIRSQLTEAYRRAPHFDRVFEMVSRCLDYATSNACEFVCNSLQECCRFLNLSTPMVKSSELPKNNSLHGVERVLDINRVLKATHYLNAAGGRELYSQPLFEQNGLKLSFLVPQDLNYRQLRLPFVPSLSIIDVLMFNSPEEMSLLLQKFELVDE